MRSAPTPMLAWKVNVRVTDTEVPGQRIVAAEGLLLGAQVAAHLLLARVVDRVFVAREIVGPREDGIAGLASRRVYTLTAMRTCLRIVAQRR